MRLIVVDDEVDVQFLFQQKFRKEIKSGEIQIHYAFDGPSAFELLKEIKSKYPLLKVIMITAYGDEQNFNLAKKHGADDYFTKPLEFDLLKTKLSYLDTV